MDSILTPSELEALLKPSEQSPTRSIRPIDIVAQDQQAFAMLPSLQLAADRLGNITSQIFTALLRSGCKVAVDPLEVLPGARLVDLLVDPRFVYGIKVGGMKDAGLLSVDGLLGTAFVASQFGGKPSLDPPTTDMPTYTERWTVSRLAEQLLESLVKVVRPDIELKAALDASSPTPLAAVSEAQAVLLITMRVAVEDQRCGITLALDTTAPGLKLVSRPALLLGSPMAQPLRRVPLSVSAVLGQAQLTVSQLIALKAGDLLVLDTMVDSAIPLQVEGQPKFIGKPMITRGSLGLEISGSHAGEDSHERN